MNNDQKISVSAEKIAMMKKRGNKLQRDLGNKLEHYVKQVMDSLYGDNQDPSKVRVNLLAGLVLSCLCIERLFEKAKYKIIREDDGVYMDNLHEQFQKMIYDIEHR
jgi:hypothetical protein